jgi:hypothetical protein
MKRHTETNMALKGHGRREESMTDPFTVHVRVINSCRVDRDMYVCTLEFEGCYFKVKTLCCGEVSFFLQLS